MNYGWCYFKRGLSSHHGKMHFLLKDQWKSICGRWSVRIEEQKWVKFIPLEEVRQGKRCAVCIKILNS